MKTTITTAVAVLSMCVVALICGVESIVSFVFPMFVGLIAGCYSSIFIAGPAWTVWKNAHPDKKKAA